jgi:hypothetical protein
MKRTSLIAAFVLALAGTSFAKEHSRKDIKLLDDSAAALSSINPDLSSRLKDYASRESAETSEASEPGEAGESAKQAESQDRRETATQEQRETGTQEQRETAEVGQERSAGDSGQDIQLLKDSADALKPTRPDLSKGLRKFAAKEQKEMKAPRGESRSKATEGGQARPGGGY